MKILEKCSSRARCESKGTESVRRLAERGSNWRPTTRRRAVSVGSIQTGIVYVCSLALSLSHARNVGARSLEAARQCTNKTETQNCRHRGGQWKWTAERTAESRLSSEHSLTLLCAQSAAGIVCMQ